MKKKKEEGYLVVIAYQNMLNGADLQLAFIHAGTKGLHISFQIQYLRGVKSKKFSFVSNGDAVRNSHPGHPWLREGLHKLIWENASSCSVP